MADVKVVRELDVPVDTLWAVVEDFGNCSWMPGVEVTVEGDCSCPIGFNCERVKGTMGRSRGLTFLVWDVGGQEKIRPLWRSYTRCTDGIIFVVDSAQPESLEEARVELWRTMR